YAARDLAVVFDGQSVDVDDAGEDRDAAGVLDSFPPRRSSDLARCLRAIVLASRCGGGVPHLVPGGDRGASHHQCRRVRGAGLVRSEEHTSELQSRFDVVSRLLLEKKKMFSSPSQREEWLGHIL